MKIAVVDDNMNEAGHVAEMLNSYALERSFDIDVTLFKSGEDFLCCRQIPDYNAVFLDIFMDKISGIDVARKIWSDSEQCLVVFLTASREHIWQAASVHGFDYILKDTLNRERIFNVVDDMRKKLHYYEQRIEFSSGTRKMKIAVNSTESIVADGNYTVFYFENAEKASYRIQFSRVADMVKKTPCFLQCNRGIIINMDYIRNESPDGFEMKNGMRYPIRKRDRTALKKKYHDYQFKKLEEM